MLLIAILLFTTCFVGTQSTCDMLCLCQSDSCTSCYTDFQVNSTLETSSGSCGCPSGYYQERTFCQFCPLQCLTCDNKNLCTECKSGYKLISGKCEHTKYIDETTWLSYQVCHDFTLKPDLTVSLYGFEIIGQPDLTDATYVSCSNLAYDNTFQNEGILKFSKGAPMTIRRQVQGAPYHQWVKVSLSYLALDLWSDSPVNISILNTDAFISVSYDNSLRVVDVCGGSQPDSLGLIDLVINSQEQNIELEIILEANTAFGIKQIMYEVGTCPRACKVCAAPDSCLECSTGYKLEENACVCDEEVSEITHYGCLLKCQEYEIFVPDSLDRCILCEIFLPHCKKCLSTTQCTVCHDHAFLFEGKCFQQCPPATFQSVKPSNTIFAVTNTCVHCDENCSSCMAQDLCLVCQQNFFNNAGQCVQSCTNGYQISNPQKCHFPSQCIPGCEICDGSQACLKCRRSYFLYEGQCIDNCPVTSYHQISTDQCQPCPQNCFTCFNEDICLTCLYGTILRNGLCVEYTSTCPSKYYFEPRIINGKCIDCPEGCDTCYRGLCYTCINGFYLDNGRCVRKCSDEKAVRQVDKRQCLWKSPLCSAYSNVDGACEKCRDLEQNIYLREQGTCSALCQIGKISNEEAMSCSGSCIQNCQICSDQSTCLKCSSEHFLTSSYACVDLCPSGTFSDSFQCLDCPINCNKCDISGKCTEWSSQPSLDCSASLGASCLQCFTENQVVCVKCDEISYLENSQCVNECSVGSFADEVSRQCRKCKPNCGECSAFSSCEKCEKGFYLLDNNCLRTCPSGYFNGVQNGECLECSGNCKTCFGPYEHQCLTCYLGYKLDHTDCVSSCPIHRFEDAYQHCDWCHQSCKQCYGPADFQCIECESSYYVYKGECFSVCPASTYLHNPYILQCRDCSWGCAICQQASYCAQCLGGFYLRDGKCHNVCPEGTYYDYNGYYCVSCSIENCRVCSQDSCSICSQGYHLYQNKCESNCPAGTYLVDAYFYSFCGSCSNGCSSCSAYYSCHTCQSTYTLINGQCYPQNQCGPSEYYDDNTVECKACLTNCQFCYGSQSCTQCFDGYYYDDVNQACVTSCTSNYYADYNKKCSQCPGGCATCTSYYNCQSCEIEYQMVDGVCSQQNPDPCVDSNCLNCPSSSECFRCSAGFYVEVDGTCVQNCQTGQYVHLDRCYSCEERCQACSASGCTQCQQNLVIFNGVCVNNCPHGFYIQNNKCVRCPRNCQLCSDAQTCIICETPNVMVNNECLTNCPASTYYSVETSSCLECGQNCQACLSFSQCQTCASGYVLHLTTGKCEQNCPEGTFKDIFLQTCQNCLFECTLCQSQAQCTGCRDGYYLYDEQCLINCPSGYLADLQTNQCLQCDETCLTCLHTTDSCNTCPEDSYLYGFTCVAQCPEGTYPFDTNRKCLPCSNYCVSCSSFSNCQQCHPVTVLLNGQCVNTCPSGYFSLNGECLECTSPCETCTGSSQYECLTCLQGFYLFNNRCVQQCPFGYYQNNQHRACQACFQACVQCSSFDTCTVCPNNEAPQNGKCADQYSCTADQTNCEHCISSSECNKCFEGYYLQNNQCVENCTGATYENAELGQCSDCTIYCLDCYSPQHCNQCEDSYFLYEGVCYENCPAGTIVSQTQKCVIDPCLSRDSNQKCIQCILPYLLSEGECVTECPQGTYAAELQCLPCSGSCETCNNLYNCEQCQAGTYKYKSTCVKACPSGYFQNSNDQICESCKDNCLLCQSESQCTKCQTGYYLSNGACFQVCPSLYYGEDLTGKCESCSNNCQQCVSQNNCHVCSDNYYLFAGKCVQNCPASYFQNIEEKVCEACSSNCRVCDQTSCTECSSVYYIYSGECYSTCPEGTYPQNGQCKPCSLSDCLSCQSATQCIECSENTYLHNGKCIQQCPDNYFSSLTDNICQSCHDLCLICSETSDHCTDCYPGYVLVDDFCRQECPSDQFQNSAGQCQGCSNPCLSCKNTNDCLSCLDGFTLFEGQCIQECTGNTYLSGNTCVECIRNCVDCGEQGCNSCDQGYYLLTVGGLQYCVMNCPPGTFINQNTQSCTACQQYCEICSDANTCDSCVQDYLNLDSQCVTECPAGYYPNSNNVCVQCSSDCQLCSNINDCEVCSAASYYFNSQCVEICPSGTYADSTRNCNSCTQQYCLQCSGPTNSQCFSCQGSYILNGTCYIQCPEGYVPVDDRCVRQTPEECTGILVNDSCLEYCLQGTYYDAAAQTCLDCEQNCKVCLSSTSCQTCEDGLKLYDGYCVNYCPAGFVNDNGVCVSCLDDNCAACMNLPSNCIACSDGFYLYEGQCLQNCTSGFYQNNGKCQKCSLECVTCSDLSSCDTCANSALNPPSCTESCSDSQYLAADNTCQSCDASCLTCSSNKIDDCLTCPTNYVLISGQCRQFCPSSHYYQTTTSTCEECSKNCQSCISATSCTACVDGYTLNSGVCILDCSALNTQTQFYFLNNDQCELCSQNCLACTEQGCETCQSGYKLMEDGSCIQECTTGQFNYNNFCTNCSVNCQSCQQYDMCQECATDYNLFDGYCVEQCPDGTYSINKECITCEDPRCSVCTQSNSCSVCESPFLVVDGACIACQPGFIYDSTKKTCVRCSSQCLTCSTNLANCQSCPAGFYLLDGDCLSQCPVGYYAQDNLCELCPQENCIICDTAACNLCAAQYYMNAEGECVSECPPATYQSTVDRTCQNCQTNCVVCTSSQCLECIDNYVFYHSRCIQNCPVGTVNVDGSCQSCETGCRVCSSPDTCTTCRSDYSLKDGDCVEIICPFGYLQLKDGTCIQSCNAGFVYNQDTLQCTACPEFCDICDLSSNCSHCLDTNFLFNAKCYENCPERSFEDSSTTCAPCSQYCLQCTSLDECTKCQDSKYLHEKACWEECPQKFYENIDICSQCSENCLECTAEGCQKCEDSFLLYDESCQSECPQNTYQDNQICMDCQSPCLQCTTLQKCETCIDGFYLTDTNQCVNNCGSGKYNDTNGQCSDCATSNCDVCDEAECFECMDTFYLYADDQSVQHCDAQCPTGQYEKETPNICVQCSENCTECSSEEICTACIDTHFLNTEECVEQCPSGTFSHDQICQNCSKSCSICESQKQCIECENNYPLFQKSSTEIICVIKCPQNYYHSNETNFCERCGDYCATCVDQMTCLECIGPDYIVAGGICIPGDCGNCTKCINKVCEECEDGFYLYSGICYDVCPDPLYGSNGTCVRCMDHCLQCPDGSYCYECETGYNFSVNQCANQAFLQFGALGNMSGFTSNFTEYTTAIYIGTSVGPVVFGEMTNTYFNIEFCQFILFHATASGNNPQVEQFLDSLSKMSLSLTSGNEQQQTTTAVKRRMLVSTLQEPQAFLAVNALVFVLAGAFLLIYLAIYIFQKNIDKCCGSCPKIFFVVNEICNFMKQRFTWIYFDFVMWLAFIPFLFFAMKQLAVFPFDNFLQGFSSILSILIVAIFPLYPFFITYLIYKDYNTLVKADNTLVEMSLYPYIYKVKRPESVVPEDQPLKDYLTFQNVRLLVDPIKYLRKLIFIIVIVASTQAPVVTLSILTSLNVLFIVYLFVFRPREMPYLVFDFIIEFLLLGFEIFMLVYLTDQSAKVSAMSIATHAIGFITANLSLIIAIILNIIAYWKIIMCIRDLYIHVKTKLQEKEKEELHGSDEEGLSSGIKELSKDLGQSREHNDGDTEYDFRNERHSFGDKQLFSNNGDQNTDSFLNKNNGMPKLKNSDKFDKFKDKDLQNLPKIRSQDSLTEQDISQINNSDVFKKNKDIYTDQDGNIINFDESGELPSLNRSKEKTRKSRGKDFENFIGKEGFGDELRNRNDDSLTQEDQQFNKGSSLIKKNKELYGFDGDSMKRQSYDGQQIPDLKQSKEKKLRKNYKDSDSEEMGHSKLSEDQLISDGKLKESRKKFQRKMGGQNILTDGKLKLKDGDKFRREGPSLKKIQSRKDQQDENDLEDLKTYSKNRLGPKDGDNLRQGDMVDRKKLNKNINEKDHENIDEGKFRDRQNNRNKGSQNEKEIEEGHFNERKRRGGKNTNDDDDIQEGRFADRNKQIGKQSDGNLREGEFADRAKKYKEKRGDNNEQEDLQEGNFVDRNKANKNSSRKEDGLLEEGNFINRENRKKQKNLNKNDQQDLQEGNLKERKGHKKRNKQDEDLLEGEFIQNKKKQNQEQKIKDGNIVERNKKVNALEEFDDFIEEANLHSANKKGKKQANNQLNLIDLKSKRSDRHPANAIFKEREQGKQGKRSMQQQGDLLEGAFKERQGLSKDKQKFKGKREQEDNLEEANFKQRRKNPQNQFDEFQQQSAQRREKELTEAKMRERQANKKSKQRVNDQDEEIDEGIFVDKQGKKANKSSDPQNQGQIEIEGGILKQRTKQKAKYQRKFEQPQNQKQSPEKGQNSQKRKKKKIFSDEEDIQEMEYSQESPEIKSKPGKKKEWGNDDFEESAFSRPERKNDPSQVRKKGNLGVLENSLDIEDNSYSKIKRNNKQELQKLSPGKASMMINEMAEEIDDAQIQRPVSRMQRPGSASSDNGSVLSHRSQRSAIHRMKAKHMNLDEHSEYSGDSDIERPSPSRAQSRRKVKRQRGQNLNIKNNQQNEDLDEMKL